MKGTEPVENPVAFFIAYARKRYFWYLKDGRPMVEIESDAWACYYDMMERGNINTSLRYSAAIWRYFRRLIKEIQDESKNIYGRGLPGEDSRI